MTCLHLKLGKLDQWKKQGHDSDYVEDMNGDIWELVYLLPEEEEF